jgi:hypothetical protein
VHAGRARSIQGFNVPLVDLQVERQDRPVEVEREQ